MKKKNNKIMQDKLIAMRLPAPLLEEFKIKCNLEYRKMSDAFREAIRQYIKSK